MKLAGYQFSCHFIIYSSCFQATIFVLFKHLLSCVCGFVCMYVCEGKKYINFSSIFVCALFESVCVCVCVLVYMRERNKINN